MTFELQRNRKQHWVAIIQTTVHTHLLQLKRIRRITLTCWRAMYSEQSCHLYDTHSTQLLYIFSISCLSSSFAHHNQTSSHAWRKKNMVLYKGDHASMIECMQNDKQTMRQYCSHFIVTISSRPVLSLHAQYIDVYVKKKHRWNQLRVWFHWHNDRENIKLTFSNMTDRCAGLSTTVAQCSTDKEKKTYMDVFW